MLPTHPHIPPAERQLIRGDMSRARAEIALGVSQALRGVAAPEMVVGHEGIMIMIRIRIRIKTEEAAGRPFSLAADDRA
ncbi:MAG: hypothetical protein ABIF82_05780 [Planctomycetota bacterium]